MILVTGGAGYIGSHYVQYALEQGEQVVVLDNLAYGPPRSRTGRDSLLRRRYGQFRSARPDFFHSYD